MVIYPEDVIDGEAIKQWLKPNPRHLVAAMNDLEKAGLLERFLPQNELEVAG